MTQELHEPLPMDCLLRHGFEQQPFDVVAGDTFLYTDPALDMVVGVLLEHLRNDDSLLLLKGDTGAGKSTQLLRLLSQGAETLEFCAFKARPGTGFTAVDYTIRQYWAQAADGDDAIPLEDLFCRIAAGGRRPVLVVDDAHHLDSGVLAELTRLRRETRRQCDMVPGLLLVGEPVLETRLDQASETGTAPDPRISVQLRPLTREQTEAYLRHRLHTAGANDPDLLAGDAALAIHQESGGLPQRINAAANRYLQLPVDESGVAVASTFAAGKAPPLWEARWFVPVVAIILGIGVFTTVINVLKSPEEELETRELLVLPEPRPLSAPEPPPSAIETPQSAPIPPASPMTEPEAPPLPHGPSPGVEGGDTESSAEAQPPSSPAAEPEPERAVSEAEPTREVRAATPPAPPAAQDPAGLRDATWLQAQPAGEYTIQILGLSDLQALRRYGREQGLAMELAWFRTVRNGQDWYVLVAGRYPDREAARSAIVQLPEAVRRNEPWIRSFGSIQEAMAAVR